VPAFIATIVAPSAVGLVLAMTSTRTVASIGVVLAASLSLALCLMSSDTYDMNQGIVVAWCVVVSLLAGLTGAFVVFVTFTVRARSGNG
jgi:hypothetical protein